MDNKFLLTHLVLYSKGWYKKYNVKSKRKTIWDDLKIIMALDGYSGEYMNQTDIFNVILNNISNSCLVNHRPFTIPELIHNIQPDNSWKYGYRVQFQSSEYNYQESVIRYIISELTFIENKDWNVALPNYSKMPRRNGIKNSDLKIISNK